MKNKKTKQSLSRRDFIKVTSAASLAAAMSGTGMLFPSGSDKIRVGLVGCGGRGTGAAIDCVNSSPNIVITALGDIFQDRWENSLSRLTKRLDKKNLGVTAKSSFSGFDAYKHDLASDIELVILASPPQFRPKHLKAAVDAGKHIFMEKPVAVDPPGARSVIASSELAQKKGLAIVAGTQRRHQAHYLEILKRIHNGDIGDIVSGQCYWNMGALWIGRAWENWYNYKAKGWSDMEWQIRNWLFLTWLSGDHIVEQHVHNLDVINWAIGAHPENAWGWAAVRSAPLLRSGIFLTTLPSSMSIPTELE